MEIDKMYIKDIEMALYYAVKSIEKEIEICKETKDITQEKILESRIEKFKFLIDKFSKTQL